MSVANPLSPRHDHHSFLPHGQISTTSRTPPTSFSSLPQTTRTQSSTITSTSSASGFPVSSKSAPSSPLNRPHLPQGLAPLSSISSIQLDLSSQFQPGQLYQRKSSSPLPSSLAAQQAGPSQQGPQPAQARSVFFSSGALARPSALSRNDCSRSRTPTINRPGSSSEDTETELESDSTFVPGRVKHKQSLSQPDLTALRSWVGRVAQGQLEERRARDARGPRFPTLAKNTPASRSIPTKAQASTFGRTPMSQSQPSLVALRGPPSPRQTSMIPPMTPVFSRHYLSSMSEGSSIPKLGSSGITGSEDADDDYESNDSPSSGSLTFSPKRTRRPRQRDMAERSKLLGLTLEPAAKVDEAAKEEPIPAFIERRLQQSSLLSLRLLAIAPSLWGICVLVQALATGVLWHDVWPWGVDLSRDALERLVQGGMGYEGTWRPVSRGDMLLSIAWAVCTAHFCFCLTTGLTHRWRSYYSLPSTITRLVSLQCLCYPATYITLWFLGADRPLLAWIVIGVTTGWSRTVQMWVTSNVTPDDRDRGDTTPGSTRKPRGRSPRTPPVPPEGSSPWDAFTYGRRWDWDAVAREVGWKVGGLLLVTTAWLFWGIESGRLVQA